MLLGMILICKGGGILLMPIFYLEPHLNSERNEPHGISDRTVRIIGVVCLMIPTFLVFSNKNSSQSINLSKLFKNDNFFSSLKKKIGAQFTFYIPEICLF